MRTKLLLFSLILLCLATPARAADINAASCSDTHVQAAVDSAVNGDRVLVPPGSCTWSTGVDVIDKGITIAGAGIGVTIITNAMAAGFVFDINITAATPIVNLTGFTFDGDNLDTASKPLVQVSGHRIDSWRVHHNEFINLKGTAITVRLDGGTSSGLIDNNTFIMPLSGGTKSIRVFGGSLGDGLPFVEPFGLGQDNFLFVEDCTFTFFAKEDGALDAFSGARYVFRHNTVTNTNVEHHGADSGGFRGVHSMEIYENTFDKPAAGNIRAHYFRAGSGVLYNNTYTGNYNTNSIVLTIFRSDTSFVPWGQCDGLSIWDENQPGQSGYACLDQPGHIFTDTSGGSNTLEGVYEWGNTLNGTDLDFSTNGHSSASYLVEGRDFFNDTVRPGYTPFTYPHPLQAGGGGNPRPDPPTNLGAIVR